ncbi:WD40/YVTN/BNR-like repeat-containing protein [Roseivirga seohaensis]|uniref:WD40/YVTN/BNR-like repeat-containing protein n=1 Tax=Roseivirga seohaensis TaxID=1914963 RepID=UPI003BAD11F8
MSIQHLKLFRPSKIRSILGLTFMLLSALVYGQKVDMDLFKDMKARSIGPAAMSGRITAIDVVESNPEIIYAGAASGGLWRSTGGGLNWEPLFDDEAVLGIGAISIYQKNPDIIWVGTGEGNPRNSVSGGYGVYRSIDGGETWDLMGLEKTRNIHRIYIHPDNPNIVYVGAIGSPWGEHEERGLFRTKDGGKTWEKILYTNSLTGVADMVADPSNPNKIFVAMWEHKRWPWFFKSGGPGSGLYVTNDGGDTFKNLTGEKGLPKGDYGRIGLAISRSRPDYVYAMIESKANGLYRSTDGGNTWELRAASANTQNIGDRPFYYADIFVDTKNENRIYSLFSRVSRSEDGGKSWEEIIPYSGVHPDHHAWWIHPEDPSYMIDGNDGGLNITRDMAKTWRFTEKLPVGQFYHVNVDNEMPYNVYGGMQDNGSWVGPAYVFNYAGIRNHDWQELSFGDGFDVAPIPGDSRYGYTMSQQGSVTRYDKVSGYTKTIQPTAPDTATSLRFNWNSPVAVDPHNSNAVYFGSQFVHYSTNRGDDWTIISPDLSTNDPEKQKQNESGGLTLDATGAENHTTIIAIAPSPLDKNVIWAGTDDGNVQVTKDKGKTWTNVAAKLPGLPAGSWIPQIKASHHNAGEAFVIANDYRRNNFTAYAYHTTDYGQTWTRIVDDNDVFGYTLSILQDEREPNLIFLGTENGLYVSFDKAQNWNKWNHGYPNASTMDLAWQEREDDLVIGTFGRAFYILDDLRPLREFAAKGVETVKNSDIVMFDVADAYQMTYRQPPGMRFPADGGPFEGENKYLSSANVKFWVRDDAKKEEAVEDKSSRRKRNNKEAETTETPEKKLPTKVKMIVLNASGDTVRTRTSNIKKGEINTISWNLDRRNPYPVEFSGGGGRFGGFGGQDREQSAGSALPGTYKIVLEFGDQQVSKMVKVHLDPRMEISMSELQANKAFEDQVLKMSQSFAEITNKVRSANEIIEKVEAQMKNVDADKVKDLKKAVEAVKESFLPVRKLTIGVPGERGQAVVRERFTTANNYIQEARRYNNSRMGAPGETERNAVRKAEQMIKLTEEKTNEFFNTAWPKFKADYDKADLSFFKDFE